MFRFTSFPISRGKSVFKKTVSFFLSAVIIITMFRIPASAAETVEWDGKSQLEGNTVYTISTEVKVTKNIKVPEGTVLNIRSGGSLIVSKSAVLKVDGEIAVSISGLLELKSGALNIAKEAKFGVYGEFLHYADAEVNVYANAQFNIYNKGYYKSSGYLNLYPDSSFLNKGYAIMTRMSITTLTGKAENAKNAQLHLQGTYKITTSGMLTNKGYMTVGSNGELKNSGQLILEKGSGYNRFGSVINTPSGVFTDFREAFDYEAMTVATIVDEPRTVSYGIDVSYAQGDIDWNRVGKTKVDFAIIRAARGKVSDSNPIKEDDYFRKNIEGALANGINVGVYFYSYAANVEEAKAEAGFLVNAIKGYELTYPVVLDMEEKMTGYSVSKITAMIEAFFEILMENGYYPMLYSYKSWLEENLDMTILDKYAIWLAQINDEVTYQGGYYIWQYSWTGKVKGINGDVDLNVSYRDFPDILRRYRLNNLR